MLQNLRSEARDHQWVQGLDRSHEYALVAHLSRINFAEFADLRLRYVCVAAWNVQHPEAINPRCLQTLDLQGYPPLLIQCPRLGAFRHLRYLYVQGAQFVEASDLRHLTRLKQVHLQGIARMEDPSAHLASVAQLTSLFINIQDNSKNFHNIYYDSNNKVMLSMTCGFSQLRRLELANNTTIDPRRCRLENLQILYSWGNLHLIGSASFPKLELLFLYSETQPSIELDIDECNRLRQINVHK